MSEADNAGVKILPGVPFVLFAAICTGVEILLAVPRIAVPQPAFLILGLAVAAGSGALAWSGLAKFFAARVNPLPIKPTTSLITGGIYRFTRNPMYLSLVALFLGVALTFGSLVFMGGALAMFFFLNGYAIPREEAYLIRTFPRYYTAYCRQVRRWV